MLTVDPELRITARQALAHPFLKVEEVSSWLPVDKRAAGDTSSALFLLDVSMACAWFLVAIDFDLISTYHTCFTLNVVASRFLVRCLLLQI
jgi:hypothetical protein